MLTSGTPLHARHSQKASGVGALPASPMPHPRPHAQKSSKRSGARHLPPRGRTRPRNKYGCLLCRMRLDNKSWQERGGFKGSDLTLAPVGWGRDLPPRQGGAYLVLSSVQVQGNLLR